ncbi:unnamed protein product [Oreochromis niloticus]|nr:unnamed protein product [Mustela putorius furo]
MRGPDLTSTEVTLGCNSLLDSSPNEVTRTVVTTICHPEFNSLTRENDICVLKLSAPVNFTDYIQPICLASENSTYNNETSSWIIGFNFDGDGLQEANVGIVENNECKLSHPGIKENMICAGETDLCLRTTGGPLMTESDSVWVQGGVYSVLDCTGAPKIYTRVSQYQKWISDTVTGRPPVFVTFTSPDSSSQTTAPPTAPTTAPICDSLFCSGENLIHFTSLCVLVVLLHVFAGTGGK